MIVLLAAGCAGTAGTETPVEAPPPAPAPVEPPAPPPPDDHPQTHVDHFSVGAEPAPAADAPWAPRAGKPRPDLVRPDEKHFSELRQITFGGENAEAYWSPDGKKLMFQRTPEPGKTCDAQYVLDLSTGDVDRISSGKGRTTCGYFAFPAGDAFVYSTTEGTSGEACPPEPDRSKGYVWGLFDYDVVRQVAGQPPTPLITGEGYDAETTLCMKDGRAVFTSTRDGDLELYLAKADGTGVERLTKSPGYDGGAFFNPACTAIIWRASRPKGAELEDFKKLLAEKLVRPTSLELFWMDLATKKVEQLSANGMANFGPYPLPDDSGVVFSSNLNTDGREFDLWIAKRADGGKAPERVTTAEGFDGFPMFSPDGTWFVFASNRANPGQRDTNLFVAKWVP
jgi:Tol biopolymer transport system component